ncbi:MAG: sn-glycerol-1-phosphate dehydrogenase [Phycisphaerae bacterium]|nr:sn-glycerol-1-phosphate dehydrogenase [Phycisphaerae bacterium]
MGANLGQVTQRMKAALERASDTRALRIGDGVLKETADVLKACFGSAEAIVIADVNTFEVAGRRVLDRLRAAGVTVGELLVFDDPDLHAVFDHVERIEQVLRPTAAIPIAVGSGTINDLTKLAAHRCERAYMVVATAASMDGYTAFGASITRHGSKQTFFCPAPRAVIADLDVIAAAPSDLNAAGYADLAAKVSAGADWLLADALGVEAIDPEAWSMVQSHLRQWVADPAAIRAGRREALLGLTEGLMMTGFAMQWCKSSRPASGADHQFSHLWDMQNHRHHDRIPYHGHKVAIGTLAATRLYEQLLDEPFETLDIAATASRWPTLDAMRVQVAQTHPQADIQAVALQEIAAKYLGHDRLTAILERLQKAWPTLRPQLREQVIPATELQGMLADAGAPSTPEEIGIEPKRLRQSYIAAQHIRRRFTVLDLAVMTNRLTACLDQLFPNLREGG